FRSGLTLTRSASDALPRWRFGLVGQVSKPLLIPVVLRRGKHCLVERAGPTGRRPLNDLHKYPRTRHLQGSRLQPGDEDLTAAPFTEIAGRTLAVEEKLDGANAAVSFDRAGRLRVQSRGHFLTGGVREKHFDLFKQWASTHAGALWSALDDRYV